MPWRSVAKVSFIFLPFLCFWRGRSFSDFLRFYKNGRNRNTWLDPKFVVCHLKHRSGRCHSYRDVKHKVIKLLFPYFSICRFVVLASSSGSNYFHPDYVRFWQTFWYIYLNCCFKIIVFRLCSQPAKLWEKRSAKPFSRNSTVSSSS